MPLWIVSLPLLLMLVFVPALIGAIQFETDYQEHIDSSISLDTTGQFDRPRPQFLYHVLLIALSRVMPGEGVASRYAAAALTLGLSYYLCTGLLVFFWLADAGRWLLTRWKWLLLVFLTLTVMLVSSINLFTWGQQNLYLGYLTANTYQNPTVLLAKPFGVLLFVLGLSIFSECPSSRKKLLLAGCIALFGTFAKPNYPMALLPVLALVTVYNYVKKQPVNWKLLGTIFLPVIAALAFQLFFYQSDQTGSFDFAPLKVMSFYTPDGQFIPRFFLSIAFPLAVYLLYYSISHKNFELNLAWLVFVVALGYAYLLAEKRWQDGNFTWASQIALFILFAVSLRFLLLTYTTSPLKPPRWKLVICVALLMLHLAGGLALYLSQLTPDWVVWW